MFQKIEKFKFKLFLRFLVELKALKYKTIPGDNEIKQKQ